MKHRRFEKLDPARQQRLFDSAAEEFGAKGYDGAQELQAGIARPVRAIS